jgi:hypothetical protein
MADKPMPENSGNEFEIVDPNSIQFSRRGRKPETNPKLVEALRGMKPGDSLVARGMQLDPNSPTFAKDRGRISSQIRSACAEAGLKKGTYQIRFSVNGTPAILL